MKALAYEVIGPLAIISLALAGLFSGVAWQQSRHAQAFDQDSGRAVARLVEKRSFTSSGTRHGVFGEQGPASYSLHYEFTHPETGELRQGSSSVGKEVWEAMREDGHYSILYNRSAPSITSLFDGRDFHSGARLAGWLSAAFALLGAAGLALRRHLRPSAVPRNAGHEV